MDIFHVSLLLCRLKFRNRNQMKSSIKLVLVAYIAFKTVQLIYALAIDSTAYDKIGFSIGLIVPLILIYFAYKDYAFFKWLISINILIAGLTTLIPAVFAISLASDAALKIFSIIFSSYLLYGSFLLFNKTINKEKFA